jgi:hypothetical protein
MPTKAELETQLHRRERDPVFVSPAVAMPVMVTGGLLLAAVLYVAAQRVSNGWTFSPYVMVAPGLIGWLIAHFEAKSHFTERIYSYGPAAAGKALAAACGAGAAVWEVWTAQVGPGVTWPWLVYGVGVATLAWWALLWWANRKEREPVPVALPEISSNMPWERLLERSARNVVLTEVRPHRAGATLVCEPAQVEGPGGVEDADVTFDEFKMCADRFATLAAAEYKRRTRARKRVDPTCADPDRMPNNCARPEPGDDDAEYLLHVTMRDVFTQDATYVPAPGPRSIYQPVDLGEYEDGSRIEIVLAHKRGKIVGHSGAGKSVEANCWIARITECSDALVWIGATDKLTPLIWPWLRSWFAGQSVAPALDYVAGQSIDEVLKMLKAAYKLTCDRNARITDESRVTCSKTEPHVFVFLEELSHTVEFDATIETHDGMTCDVSTLLMLLARAGRSAGVSIVIMSQSALHGSAGDCASEIIRNIEVRVCLRTMEAHDGMRTIPALAGVDTTIIPLYTKIVQPAIETTRATPGKAPILDGTRLIDPVAIRNATYRPRYGVEAESDLGPDYATRWDPKRHPELARAVEKHGLQWRIPDPPPPVNSSAATMDNHPQEGGGEVMFWTRKDDAAVTALLETDEEVRTAGGFRLPNGDKEYAELTRLAAEIVADADAATQAAAGHEPKPLPPILDRIMKFFDEQEEAGELAEFYLTDSIAKGIGHDDPKRLGAEIQKAVGFRSRNATRGEDRQQRKGWDTRALCEAATRLRFGL